MVDHCLLIGYLIEATSQPINNDPLDDHLFPLTIGYLLIGSRDQWIANGKTRKEMKEKVSEAYLISYWHFLLEIGLFIFLFFPFLSPNTRDKESKGIER